MGNTNSSDATLHDIQNRLSALEQSVPKDDNKDNLDDDLEEEILYLRQANKELEDRIRDLTENKARQSRGLTGIQDSVLETQPKLFGELSKAYIDSEIDKILANNDVNVSIIPDYYEKKIYRNIFNMLFGLLESITQTSEIKFLHHKITFSIQPDTSSPEESVPSVAVDSVPKGSLDTPEYLEDSEIHLVME